MILTPPETGNAELDSYLYRLSMLLGQLNILETNADTGEIKANGVIQGYLYKYIHIKYADDRIGTNLSNVQTNRLYYGVRNTDETTESTNPALYTWYQVSGGGFSTTKNLYYKVTGGRQIQFDVNTAPIDALWLIDPGTPIDLDVITTASGPAGPAGPPGATGATGATGAPGANGADGTKAIALQLFRWSNTGAPSHTQAFTYTWATGAISALPAGWSTAAPVAPGTGYTLYMISLTLVASATAVTTAANWSAALDGSIGYREDGTIGPQGSAGNSARMMYAKAASSTTFTPGSTDTTAGGSSFPDTGTHFGVSGLTWQQTPPVIVAGESLFQSDGIYSVTTGNTVWQTPYLSNLKVGSLSAITANLGVVSIAAAGSLYSGKSSFADTTPGFFIGNDTGTPKLAIGNAAKNLKWDGTNLTISGELAVGSVPAISGTTMTGAGARFYDDGRFVLGKAAQNLTYNGSDLYLNGFYANSRATQANVSVHTGAAVNFATATLTTAGQYVSRNLQKPNILGLLNQTIAVRLNAATQSFLDITVTLWRDEYNGSSWINTALVKEYKSSVITGTDTAAAYQFPVVIAIPHDVGSIVTGREYRLYAQVTVSCYTSNRTLLANMASVLTSYEISMVELKI